MPGELGNVGSASLTFKNISNILDVLLLHAGDSARPDGTLSEIYKSRLELTVRLLACAQRLYLSKAEWEIMEDPVAEITAHFGNQPVLNDYNSLPQNKGGSDQYNNYGVCSPSVLAESPVVHRVLRHLCAVAPGSVVSAVSDSEYGGSGGGGGGASQESSQRQGTSQSAAPRSPNTNALLEALALSVGGLSVKESQVIALLHVVSAASEVFPLGGLWTSSTGSPNNWRKVPAVECGSISLVLEPVNIGTGSLADLAVVVRVVGSVLETHGGYNASAEIQRWVLVCLNKLAIATDAHLVVLESDALASSGLTEAWRQVWQTLLRSNLSFSNLTKSTKPGSHGDLVLRLLTQIIRFSCVDPETRLSGTLVRDSFLVKHQSDLWSLPVFERFDIHAPSAFMLIFAVLCGCGLSDRAGDNIARSISGNEEWLSRIQRCGVGRRSKLLCYCLHFLEQSAEQWKDEQMISIVIACTAVLVNGCSSDTSSTSVFFGTADSDLPKAGFLPGDTVFTHIFQNCGRLGSEELSDRSSSSVFSCLWAPSLRCSEGLASVSGSRPCDDSVDIVGISLLCVQLHTHKAQELRTTSHSVGQSQCKRLFEVAGSSLGTLVSYCLKNEKVTGIDSHDSGCVNELQALGQAIPFSFSSIVLKGYLTLVLSSRPELLLPSKEQLSSNVSELFLSVSKDATSSCRDQDDLVVVLADLVRIVRGLVRVNSNLGLLWSTCLYESAAKLYDFCEDLLSWYNVGGVDEAMPAAPEESATIRDDLFSDEESDDAVPRKSSSEDTQSKRASTAAGAGGRKRKPQEPTRSKSRKRRRGADFQAIKLNQQCAYLVGRLLIALNPTLRDCEFVATTLLGTDNLEDCTSEYEIDTWGGMHTVDFICTEEILIGRRLLADSASFLEEQPDCKADSVASLICRVIRCVRLSAMPHSAAHLFGYSHCAKIVRIFDANLRVVSLSSDEARDVVNLLRPSDQSNERRSLNLRPRFRVRWLVAAISVFRSADACVHAEMDKDFGRLFVLPSLWDVNSDVRRQGCIAVMVALPALVEERVIESVRKQLAPVTCSVSPNDDGLAYREWYSNKTLGASGGNEAVSATENQVWEDAYFPVRYDVLCCWSIIAEVSSSREVLEQVLFDLVRLASSIPTLQGLCFQVIDRLADRKGYATAERLLDAEARDVARRWLETGSSLFDFPLMTSGPSTFQRLLHAGQLWYLAPDDGGLCEDGEFDHVRESSSLAMIRRYESNFLPQIIVRSVSSLVESSATKDGRRFLLENGFLKQYCAAFDDRFDDDVAKIVIEKQFPSILAETLELRRRSSGDGGVIADGIIRIIKGILTDDLVERLCKKVSGEMIRRVLVLIGDSSGSATQSDFTTTLRNFLESRGEKASKLGVDLFERIGCTAIELLLFTIFRLSASFTESQMVLRWQSVQAVLQVLSEQIQHDAGGRLQLGFSIHSLLSIVSDLKLTPVQLLALRSLKEIIEEMARVSWKSREDLSGVLRNVVASILELHRSFQNKFVETCTNFQLRDERLSGASLGVLVGRNGGDVRSVDVNLPIILQKYYQCVSQDVLNGLAGTFDLLRVLVENGEKLGISADELRHLVLDDSKSALAVALAESHQSFSAQVFINGVVETDENGDSDVTSSVDRLASSASTSQTFVQAELAEIESCLRETRINRAQQVAIPFSGEQLNRLSQLLLRYCSAPTLKDTKVAASRCLGEIGFALSETDSDVGVEYDLKPRGIHRSVAVGENYSLKGLEALAIGCLIRSLQDSEPKTAMVAMDTLRALLSLRVGEECCGLVEGQEASTVLQSILSCARSSQPRHSNLGLSKEELALIRRCETIQMEGDDHDWCWEDSFWQAGIGSASFDAWICRLVPALLACKYSGQDGRKSHKTFFQKCQRMSCLDPTFARTIFPAVVLHLLLETGEDHPSRIARKHKELGDTWIGSPEEEINIRLSASFNLLLRSCADSFDSQVVELAVDVLDMLRCITQDKFVMSPNHQRNKSGSFSAPAVPWRGVPYGIVLNLDGVLVANAFIRARRFEAALFYAEMYADSRFRGSTAAPKVLALEKRERQERLESTTTTNISGFDRFYKKEDGPQIDSIEEDCLAFMTILRMCFANIGEHDCRKAVDRQASDFAFLSSSGALSVTTMLETDKPSLQKLQKLDNLSFIDRRSGASKLWVADCLEGVGCYDTLETYIAGLKLSEDGNVYSDFEKDELREKWFECRLRGIQWEDDVLFQNDTSESYEGSSSSFRNQQTPVTGQYSDLLDGSEISDGSAGFYELIVHALDTLRSEDFEICRVQLREARIRFVDTFLSTRTERGTTSGIFDVINCLQVLNDLDDFVGASGSAHLFLSRFGALQSAERFQTSGGTATSFSDCVREIVLRSLRSKSTASLHAVITESLVSHLHQQFERSLRSGCHQAAGGALQRLYGIARTSNQQGSNQSASLLRLRLKEAALFEQKGDYSGAIRVAKLTARNLQDTGQGDVERSAICADALSLCGKWTAKHKVEPANSILANYLSPAAQVSETIYNHLPNDKNADRLTEALLSQSELVSSLLESVSSRVSSNEWKRKEIGRKDRMEKLDVIRPKYQATQKRFYKLSKTEQENTANPLTREFNEIAKAYLPLNREQTSLESERNDTLSSLEEYRKLALQPIVSALSVAGVGVSFDLSKHVYRFVSLWFSIESNQWPAIDPIIEDAIRSIPTFRFVPLVAQLFSRIETTSSETMVSQTRLQQLVKKMSLDHPYHCVAPLITHSRIIQDKTNSKAEAASLLLGMLGKEDPHFIGELIENYNKLFTAYLHLVSVNYKSFEKRLGKKIPLNEVCKNAALHLDKCLGSGSRKVQFPPCIFTKPPLLRPGCDYIGKEGTNEPIGSELVDGFESCFIILSSGLSKPKVVVCKGTKGGCFKQLVKGDDDIRQDAVMEQLFVYVNGLMARQRRTALAESGSAKYDLRLVTYNIVPLNHQAGVRVWQWQLPENT